MSAPFHFPTEYGKMGNWPGSIGPVEAQAIFMAASERPKGSKFVELAFDGGRTLIALNWAAKMIDASIDVLGVYPNESGMWFRRALAVFQMNREKIRGHEDIPRFAADLIVIGPSVSTDLPSVRRWIDIAEPDAIVIRIGDGNAIGDGFKSVAKTNTMGVWRKQGTPISLIDTVVENVVDEFSESKTGIAVAENRGAKIHGLRRVEKRNGRGNGADTEVHEVVAATKGD